MVELEGKGLEKWISKAHEFEISNPKLKEYVA